MLDMPEAQPRPCVACSRVVTRVAGYRVRLHHTDTRVTHKRPYPLFTPTYGPHARCDMSGGRQHQHRAFYNSK